MFRVSAAVLTTVAALAVCAPTASAATYAGSGTDPQGDASPATLDIVAADASYDDAGTLTGSVTLAADPASAPTFVFLLIGTRSGAACGAPFMVLGGNSDNPSALSGLDTDAQGDYEAATLTKTGAKVSITATSARLAGRRPDCLSVSVQPKGVSGTVDQLDVPATLTASTPPPTQPVPPPAPPAPAPAPTPAPAPAPAAPVQQATAQAKAKPKPKVAQLAVTVTGVPKTIRRARWMTLKVRVANTGTATASSVRLKVANARGLSAKPRTLSLKTVKAGQSTTRRVKLSLTRKARKTTNVLFTATGAKKLAARGRLALTLGTTKAIKKTKTPAAGPQQPADPLVGTFWWYTINHVDWSWDNHGVYFVDDKWAYRGLPKGGLPTCTSQTAGVDDKGNATDGCIPYTYDAASGNVTLGSAAGTYKDGKLSITDQGDVRDFERLVIPPAGSRYAVTLEHASFQGLCGLITGCTTSQDTLQLMGDGEFIKNGSTLTTTGDANFGGGFVAAGSYPPDQHGTYDIQNGQIHLAFADGSVQDSTFAILTKDGQPDPVNEGLMVDQDNFYPDPSPGS